MKLFEDLCKDNFENPPTTTEFTDLRNFLRGEYTVVVEKTLSEPRTDVNSKSIGNNIGSPPKSKTLKCSHVLVNEKIVVEIDPRWCFYSTPGKISPWRQRKLILARMNLLNSWGYRVIRILARDINSGVNWRRDLLAAVRTASVGAGDPQIFIGYNGSTHHEYHRLVMTEEGDESDDETSQSTPFDIHNSEIPLDYTDDPIEDRGLNRRARANFSGCP
jgi:hypothetical protein